VIEKGRAGVANTEQVLLEVVIVAVEDRKGGGQFKKW